MFIWSQAVPQLHGNLGATAQLQLAKQKREAAAAKAGGKQKQPVLVSAKEPFESLPAAHQEWIKQHSEQLGQLPGELCPTPKHGKHSYTVCSQTGARVEVLLRDRAFHVKATGQQGRMPEKPRIRWDRDGSTLQTWSLLRELIGWAP